jgi:hypothetical protein
VARIVEAPALHLRGRAIQQLLLRCHDLRVAPLVVDDEHEIGQGADDRGEAALAAREILGARGHAVLELGGVAFDALAELRLADGHGQGVGQLLRDLERHRRELAVVVPRQAEHADQLAVGDERHVDEQADAFDAQRLEHAG